MPVFRICRDPTKIECFPINDTSYSYLATPTPPRISLRTLSHCPIPYTRSNATPRPNPSPSAPIRTMCLFRINPSRAPIDPPGAAPVLMTLEEDHMLSIMAGNESRPNPLSDLVDARGKSQPVRPVSHESLQERRESLANGTRRVEIGK